VGSAEVVEEVDGSGVGVGEVEVVGSGLGTGVMMIVGLEEVEVDLLRTVEVVVVGTAVTVWVFFEEDEGGALLVVGS
jgi:hypothetical protein